MTHASEGQYDTNRLEFRRIKVYHWQWHALRVLSSSMEAESVGGLVLWRGRDLGTCPQKSNWEWPCWSRAEPGGLPRWLMTAPQTEEVSCRTQVRGVSLGWGINTASTSLRTEAHLTRKSSEAARGVLSRIIKKKRSYFFSLFLEILHI